MPSTLKVGPTRSFWIEEATTKCNCDVMYLEPPDSCNHESALHRYYTSYRSTLYLLLFIIGISVKVRVTSDNANTYLKNWKWKARSMKTVNSDDSPAPANPESESGGFQNPESRIQNPENPESRGTHNPGASTTIGNVT